MSAVTTQIGPYRGVAIGHGGFATVWRVTDATGHPAALKWAGTNADPVTNAALEHEYEVLVQLIHPQLPRARDFGVAAGRPYIVTDLIGGPALWDRFVHPTAEDFLLVLRQIASVLLFIHHRGWVHGDLKPDNFRWRAPSDGADDAPDCLCLLDFGLARPVGDQGRPRGAGTIGYCAPEFLRGEPADGRADWYAAGAILYEWVYGRRPFAAAEPAIEVSGHLESAPSFDIPPVRPAPEWAATVIARLLAKKPGDRGRDIVALMSWLAGFEPSLAPYALLTEQLPWHLRSEEYRWDDQDRLFVDQLVADTDAGGIVRWSINAYGDTAPRLPRQIAFALTRRGWAVNRTGEPGANRPGEQTTTSVGSESALVEGGWPIGPVHIEGFLSDVDAPCRVSVLWSPSPPVSPAPSISPDETQRELVFLPWDAVRTQEFLARLTGDEDFAGQWAEAVWEATAGIPRAVSSVVRHLIARGYLHMGVQGWVLNEAGLHAWSTTTGAHAYYHAVIGDLSAVERRLIDWLALGRLYGCREVLEQLWDRQWENVQDVLCRLATRGLIVAQNLATEAPCFDVRLRLSGWDAVWRAQMLMGEYAEDATALATAIAARQLKPDLIRESVLAACYADGGDWQNAARHALAAATLEIAVEKREAARRHIMAAENVAGRITDVGIAAHWRGRARMVQGDLEKAAGQLDKARRIYQELLALGRRAGDQQLLAETLKDLGDLYRITRRFEKGIRALRRARRLWEAIGDRLELSRTLTNIGNMYWVAADPVQARFHYQEALTIQRQEPGGDRFAAVILSNLGAVNLVEYDYAEAESHFREAFAIHQRRNDPVEMARALNNLGALNFMQGNLDEAASRFAAAADHNARAQARSEELFNRRNLIEVALERGDLRSVVTLGAAACETAAALGDVATGAEVSALLAEAYLRAGDFRTAQLSIGAVSQALEQITNDELRLGLALVSASRLRRLGFGREALQQLDTEVPFGTSIPNRHLYLDSVILRLRIAVDLQDIETADMLWRHGSAEAERIGAPHKAAQLAFARLPEDPTGNVDASARRRAEEFISQSPRWHWVAAFRVWQAQRQAVQSDQHAALATIAKAIAQLRRDGNWDTLWRALAVQGRLMHDQVDYEPALRSLNEAARILHVITQTIDDAGERAQYGQHPLARMLSQTRMRIQELVT